MDRPDCTDTRPVRGRIRYMFTLSALIDLIAILPFYLAFFVSVDLRFLRVIRLLRVFKLTRYSAAMQVLLDVLQDEFNTFMAAFFLLAVLLVLASSGIYLIEHDVQPEAFGSIPLAMWWSLVTLTTVGYGDVTPVTTLGKFFGGCITIIGVGMVALPAGILASGFGEHLQRRRETYKELLDDVLEDGIVTEEEESELEALREELELSREDAEQLFSIMVRESEGIITSCPHCGKSLKEIIRKSVHEVNEGKKIMKLIQSYGLLGILSLLISSFAYTQENDPRSLALNEAKAYFYPVSLEGAQLAKQQMIYVPTYSHVYLSGKGKRQLATTLSLRNTDPKTAHHY